jgi:hypothetical protein
VFVGEVLEVNGVREDDGGMKESGVASVQRFSTCDHMMCGARESQLLQLRTSNATAER